MTIILSGEILANVLYSVSSANVVYNGTTITPGNTFRGVASVRTFTGSGIVNELSELAGFIVEVVQNGEDKSFVTEVSKLSSFSIEVSLNDQEKIVQETTKITAMGIELIDYPFYAFQIIETRL